MRNDIRCPKCGGATAAHEGRRGTGWLCLNPDCGGFANAHFGRIPSGAIKPPSAWTQAAIAMAAALAPQVDGTFTWDDLLDTAVVQSARLMRRMADEAMRLEEEFRREQGAAATKANGKEGP